jgi:hypothetical protein
MADTNHTHVGSAPVEGDGISYRGIVWFVVILAATVVVSQGLMVFAFKFMEHEGNTSDTARSPLATPVNQLPPAPHLLYEKSDAPAQNEPGNLARFRQLEDQKLHTYEWIDQTAGTVRIPIDRAKTLILERGLPARDTSQPAPPAAKAAPAKAAR